MAQKTIYEFPSITDTVVIPIVTPDAYGCQLNNPYKVNNVTIYFVERDFSKGNIVEFDKVHKNANAERIATDAQNLACSVPSIANTNAAKLLRAKADSNRTSEPVYYNETTPVAIVGNSQFPAWLSTDLSNAFIQNITEDKDGNPIYGNFQYVWNPLGMREGDYFVCWTWTPSSAGDSLSSQVGFILSGNTVVTTSIPTHFTQPEKYETLLHRYLPEMYKDPLTDLDLSPYVLKAFNAALAKGFTDLENLANQIIDLNDANATHEAYLNLLARNFGMSLRSSDPTRWRKQIKRAIPLYKKKGTIGGIKEAFELAGMKMNRFVRLWQLISPYTWIDAFVVDKTQTEFELSRVSLSIDSLNFEVSYRKKNNQHYTIIPLENISIVTDSGFSTLTIPNALVSDGERVKILYKYAAIGNSTQQDIEDYIRLLPLGDTRDETNQNYPLKNWNVRMLEEDDPLFSILIPTKNPYHDFLVFGKIRTEFPYSENVYNMDEYSGSLRESKEPCHIDKDFVDSCEQCLSSKFSIDIEVENLSNDRIMEAQNIIEDFIPFHLVPQTINFSGNINDFVKPPIEQIQCLMFYRGEENVISGEGQMVFNRAMIDNGRPLTEVLRSNLTSSSSVATGSGTAYNNKIKLFSPDVALERLGMIKTATQTVMEIFGPHSHAGKYQLENALNHTADIYGSIYPTVAITQPLNQAAFSFTISNIIYSRSNTTIAANNVYTVKDPTWNFDELNIKTQWDIDHAGYTGNVWSIKMTAYSSISFPILNTQPDGSFLLAHNNALPSNNANNIAYQLLRSDNSVVKTGSVTITTVKRGLVTIDDAALTDIRTEIKTNGTYFLNYVDNGTQYPIVSTITGQTKQFYIENWNVGTVAGKNIDIYQRLVDKQYGLLTYEGIKLQTNINYESTLSISNGDNPISTPLENSHFKENFLIKINDPANGANNEFFAIAKINGTTITLSGDIHYWTTNGTNVSFEIFRYDTNPITVDGVPFSKLDRRGSEIISSTIENATPFAIASTRSPAFEDTVRQEEAITYRIQYANGTTEEGKI